MNANISKLNSPADGQFSGGARCSSNDCAHGFSVGLLILLTKQMWRPFCLFSFARIRVIRGHKISVHLCLFVVCSPQKNFKKLKKKACQPLASPARPGIRATNRTV